MKASFMRTDDFKRKGFFMSESKLKKERYWTFIMYEDSRPSNWLELLQEEMIQIAVSPRHDRDMKEETGEIKKAHYHVLLCFNGPTTYNRALEIAEKVGASIVKRVLSVKGMYDYFTHKWNEEKAKYNEEDIICINGFNINDYGMSNNEIENLKRETIRLIRSENIKEYAVLVDFCEDNNLREMGEVVSKNTQYFNAYLKSKKYIDLYKEV